jgi:hypothetical protein
MTGKKGGRFLNSVLFITFFPSHIFLVAICILEQIYIYFFSKIITCALFWNTDSEAHSRRKKIGRD